MKKSFTCRSRLTDLCLAKIKILISPPLALLLALCLSVSAYAQTGKVQGTVLDEKGGTLPGVSVKLKGTEQGTVTDMNGKFSLNASAGQTLVFTYVGYTVQQVTLKDLSPITIILAPNASALNEVVVVGYGSQKKLSLTTAVTSVTSKEIVTTKNENVENMLTGKVAGLQVMQNTSEPGDFNNNISIRGFGNNPLIVVDGVQMSNFNVTGGTGDNSSSTSNILSRLDPNDIESISVLKDASASVYGVKAANGVILITTKRGKKGALQLDYSGTFGSQVPSGLPKPVDATQYMTLVNEQSMHQANGGRIVYTPQDFADYANGTKKSTDWYDAVFKKSAFQEQHNLTATGGNESTTYLLSGGFTGQNGFLTSNDLNYKRYNVRSNVTSKITKDLTFNLNLSAIMDQKKSPNTSVWWTTRETWRELPIQTIYANNNPAYYNQGLVDGGNPIAYENTDVNGYANQNNKFFNGVMSLEYKVPFVPGLAIKAMYSYNDQIQDNKTFGNAYNLYDYDSSTGIYTPHLNGSPSFVQRQYFNYVQNTDQLSINYDHTFGGKHNISALLLYEGNGQNADNFGAYRQLAIPVDQIFAGNSTNQNASQVLFQNGDQTLPALYNYATNSVVGRLHYDYEGKYLAEFSFRNDESSKFPPNQKSGFFPSGSAAWNISEEDFWKNSSALSFIDQLKLRASYGVLGDDNTLYFQFLQGYYYPANGNNNQVPSGSVFGGNSFLNAVQSTGLPNPNISWETSHTFDAGIDFDAWKGMLGFTFDYFIRNRSGLFSSSTLQVPDVLGTTLPQQNLNSDRTTGFDFEVTHRSHIGKFNYNIRGTFSYARTNWVKYAESKHGNSYLDWQQNNSNRYQAIQWGLGGQGQYQNYSQILNSPVFVNRGTVVGDYVYQDWNGDGQIDGNDNHPIAYGSNPNGGTVTPQITYGLSLGGSYKSFDFNLLFQGAAKIDISYIEQLNIPLWGGGSALTQFLNDWHPANPNADPYNPNTAWTPGQFAYTGTTANTGSTFNFQSAAYVRLKSAEIGYTLPASFLSHIGIKGFRVFANGYNLITLTKVKYVDPEHPTGLYGYLYPLDKLFNVGLNVKF